MAEVGLELVTPGSGVRHATNCAMKPGTLTGSKMKMFKLKEKYGKELKCPNIQGKFNTVVSNFKMRYF